MSHTSNIAIDLLPPASVRTPRRALGAAIERVLALLAILATALLLFTAMGAALYAGALGRAPL